MAQPPGIRAWVLTALLALAASAAAEPIVPIDNAESVIIRFEPVDNSPGGPALEGFVTTDIRFDVGPNDVYAASELLIELSQGGFYRDPFGSPLGLRPSPSALQQSASLAFDTFFAGGQAIGGGALNLGGMVTPVWPADDGRRVDQAWSPAGQPVVTNVTGYLDARLTLSSDAVGEWSYLFNGSTGLVFRSGVIANGQFVPEPTLGVVLMVTVLVARNNSVSSRRRAFTTAPPRAKPARCVRSWRG